MKLKVLVPLVALAVLSACHMSENKKEVSASSFVDLGNQEGFRESHEEPSDIRPAEKHGKMIKLEVEGEDQANAYFIENSNTTNHYLLVIHEWWGLNDHIKREAERWYEKLGDVHVLALDLYDGNVAKTRDKAREYMQGASEERITAIIDAVLNHLPVEAEIATIGWCFGGGWSLKSALQAGERTKACVIYYGMPIKDPEQLGKLNSDALFIYGKKDQWIDEKVAEEFKKNMETAKKKVQVLAYDADHAFANPSSERYIEKAATDANKKAYAYLSERFSKD